VETGEEIRKAYAFHRSRYESFKVGSTVEYRVPVYFDRGVQATPEKKATLPLWPRVARKCFQMGVDPISLVRFAFSKSVFKEVPEPTHLMGDKLFAEFRESQLQKGQEGAAALAAEKSYLSDRIAFLVAVAGKADVDAWADALTDAQIGVSPLLRYCVAKSIGSLRFEKIASVYEGDAAMQFVMNQRAYEENWEAMLPPGFKAKAARRVNEEMSGT